LKEIAFRTERLTLRPLGVDEAERALAFELRNRDFFKPWEPARDSAYYTLERQRELIAEDEKQIEAFRGLRLWLFEDDRLLGTAALSNIVRGAFLSCHLGYKLDRGETGKGYMTEAIGALVTIAFEALELHRIEANIMPRNAASLKLVKKLGFYEEGLARKYLKIDGVWEDHLHMVLRNEGLE